MFLSRTTDRLFLLTVLAALAFGAPSSAFAQEEEQPQQEQTLPGQQPQPFAVPPVSPLSPLNQASQAILDSQNGDAAAALLQGGTYGVQRRQMTQQELDEELKNRESPQYKAHRLAKQSKATQDVFGLNAGEDDIQPLTDGPVPKPMEDLQRIHRTHGKDLDISDDLITGEMALDMRKDAQREAAMSYGARGGLAKRSFEIMEELDDYQSTLDGVFNFRALLMKAPSGLLIEPPIVREAVDALEITENGNEAAVADQVLKINKQARIVTAPREWRQYIVINYETEIKPPPRILWPKDVKEQRDWDDWVKKGWEAGILQAEDTFDSNLARLLADYNGMVRYRVLLAEGKMSQPYAMHEDRGVTGGRNEMRVGDRALRLTGPSQFLTGSDIWKPADR